MSHYNVSFKCGSFLIAFLLLCGCAAMGPVKFDRAANTHIKKIALLRVNEPSIAIYGAPKFYSNPMLYGGGIVGGLLSYYTTVKPTVKKRSGVFLKAKDESHVFFGPPMAAAIQQELTQKGYDVIYLEDMMMGRPPPNGVVQVKDIKDVQTDADAILFVHLCAGYACQSKKKGFKPSVFAAVRLYDSRSKKVIYSRNIDVGEGSRASRPNVTFIPPDEKYTYNSFDAVKKNFDEAVQGITDCQNKIAARIAEHLK